MRWRGLELLAQAVAQLFDAIERARRGLLAGVAGCRLAREVAGLRGLTAEPVERLGGGAFARCQARPEAHAQPFGTVLQAQAEFTLLSFAEGVAQTRSGRLAGRFQGLGGVFELLFEALPVALHGVFLARQLLARPRRLAAEW